MVLKIKRRHMQSFARTQAFQHIYKQPGEKKSGGGGGEEARK